MLLPWVDDKSMAGNMAGDLISYPIAGRKVDAAIFLMMTIIAGINVSRCEIAYGRRAAFCHVGLYCVTVLLFLLMCVTTSIVARYNGEVRFGAWRFFVSSTLVHAISVMLSTPRKISDAR